MSNPTPVRLQRSRAKGSRLVSPNGLPVVCVTRGTKWGNHIRVASLDEIKKFSYFGNFLLPRNAEQVIIAYEHWINRTDQGRALADAARKELRGKNLACWCKPGKPCHADVLLEIANGEK